MSASKKPSLRRDKQQEDEDLHGGGEEELLGKKNKKKKNRNHSRTATAGDIDPELQQILAQKLEDQFDK